jgi:TolB-like protein/class 3 adenylate cyclase/Tfp pilus assembly protein PilF
LPSSELPVGATPEARDGSTRRLTAILSADVAGYSRLMHADETGTHGRLKACRGVVDPLISDHGGRIVGTAGDGLLAEFASVLDAVRAAVAIQRALGTRNRDLPADQWLAFRIGVNLGDVIVDGDDIFGDGVNIAARLQAIGDPGGIVISGGVHDQIKGKLDLAFEDRGTQKVKNIADPIHVYTVDFEHRAGRPSFARHRMRMVALAGVGLLLAGIAAWFGTPLLLERTSAYLAGEPSGTADPARSETELPRIAVLPFENLSGDPGQVYFSDGVTEDIIIELSRFSDLIVMPWSAVQPLGERVAEAGSIGAELHVRYLAEGSIRKAGDQVRATVQLSDARTSELIWSERYEEPLDEIFALQDRIVRQIVDALAIRVARAEQLRASAKPTDNLRAYDLVLRGRLLFAQITRATTFGARALFEQAVELDPTYAGAHAWLAKTYLQAAEQGWAERPAAALGTAGALLEEAIRLDPEDAGARGSLASVYLWQRRYDQAREEARRAIRLNPGDFESLDDIGSVLLFVGETDEAMVALERLFGVDPSPNPTEFSALAAAYMLTDRLDEAVEVIERSLARYPDAEYPFGWAIATAAYQLAGEDDRAAAEADRLRTLSPFFSPAQFAATFRDPDDRRKLEKALTAAGL